MKRATLIFSFVLLFSWSGISWADSASETKAKPNQLSGETSKQRTSATRVFGRLVGITLGAAMDGGLAVAGFSWARSGHANVYTQVFTQHAAPGLLGSRGAAGEAIKAIPGDPLGYKQSQVEGNPMIVGSADTNADLTVVATHTGEIVGDKDGNMFLCYNDGCKQIQGAVLLVASEEGVQQEGVIEASTDGNPVEPQIEPIQAVDPTVESPAVQPVSAEISYPTVQPAVTPLAWNTATPVTPQTEEIRTVSAPASPFGISPKTANP